MESLADEEEMWCRDAVPLYDTFEPEYIATALTSEVPLGELIFGVEEWQKLGRDRGITDPLSQYYEKHGAFLFLVFNDRSPFELFDQEFLGRRLSYAQTTTRHSSLFLNRRESAPRGQPSHSKFR